MMAALTLNNAKLALELISSGLDVAPIPEPFKSAVTLIPKTALQIVAMVEGAKSNEEDAKELGLYIANLTGAVVRALESKRGGQITPELKIGVSKLTEELVKVSKNVEKLKSRNPLKRYIGVSEDALKVASFKERISQAMNLLQLESLLTVAVAVNEIKQGQIDQDEMRLIDRLGDGDTGSGDKERACLDGTRENILQDIEVWAEEPNDLGKRILWLSGAAGTGKSGVLASMEARLRAKGQLGAVFYFVREQPARNKLVVLGLARQLALQQPSIQTKIIEKLKADPDLPRKLFTEQYRQLIHEPVSSLHHEGESLTIMLDALDECDDEFIATILLRVVKSFESFPPRIRFVFTSRAETYLEAILRSPEVAAIVEHRSLDQEDPQKTSQDIEKYLRHRLPIAVQRFGIRDTDWPGSERRARLVQKSSMVFIWASTIVALVADKIVRNPEFQLTRILNSSSLNNLDYLYRDILDRAFPPQVDSHTLGLLKTVLGVLVTAQESLDVIALAELVDSTVSTLRTEILGYLQAVLIVPDEESSALRFIHQSFVDFITTSASCPDRFSIQSTSHHERMALACFRLMKALRSNICGMKPWHMNNDIDDLHTRINSSMSSALQYACKYWDIHLMKAETKSDALCEGVRLFANERLLYWLEALSLMGRTTEAIRMARDAERWIADVGSSADPSLRTTSLLHDIQRFVMLYGKVISESAIHIYVSVLPGIPTDASLWSVYGQRDFGVQRVTYHRPPQHWSEALWNGTGHTDWIMCLAFSPHGRVVVSGSFDNTLRVWDVSTGAQIGEPLKGHTDWIKCLSISPDGRVVVSGSNDCTLRLWDISARAQIGEPLEGHTDSIICLAFSPDGRVVVSGSDDRTLRLWDVSTGAKIGEPLQGHTDDIICLAFSPDGRVVVSGSEDRTLRLWDISTGAQIREPLQVNTDEICLAFSSDGRVFVPGSDDRTLRLWSINTGAQIGEPLQCHGNEIICLAFAPDGRLIFSQDGSGNIHSLSIVSNQTSTGHSMLHDRTSSCIIQEQQTGWMISALNGERVFWMQPMRMYTVQGSHCAFEHTRGVVDVIDFSVLGNGLSRNGNE